MDTAILIIVAVVALGALGLGTVLLVMYLRGSRMRRGYGSEPIVYGNLVQCPHCAYMNPLDSAACLNCRQPLPSAHSYQPSGRPSYPAPYGQPVAAPDYHQAGAPPAPADQGYGGSAPGAYPGTPAPDATVPPSYHKPVPGPLSSAPPQAEVEVAERAPDMAYAWLEGIGGAAMGHRTVLTQTSTLVGRSTACDIQVYDPKVSRRHFLIRFANGMFFLQDQQSSRGTRVNGERVMAQRLNDGDRIDVGDSSMIFHMG